MNVPLGASTGVAATQYAFYKPINPPIPVPTSTIVLAATASSVASAISWKVTLECINQSNVVDDGILEPANTTQLGGQAVTASGGVTVPTTIASPTNITAGTITTVTNLTNAPTNGDLTAAMKSSVNASTIATVTNLTNAPTAGDFTSTMKTSLATNTGAGKTTFNE